ncbi:MAG: MoaD/ThiS family protein [Planctomycetes bacterium]|nr:MoaD/ThiS family protein [Planctomycetota bacterium]
MSVVLRIPTPLRKYTGGKAEVQAEGVSVREVFDNVETVHRGVKEKVFDESGSIRRFINVFINGEDVRYMQGPETKVKPGDELSIVPAIAGGSSPCCCKGRRG